MTCIALIGEGMVELSGAPFGALGQAYGGDTLNTAVYLARLIRPAANVRYISALGVDALSDSLLSLWRAEGVDTACVLRDPRRMPGLYWIQVDARGERSFLYWRSDSAARYLLQHAEYERVRTALRQCEAIYLSGISLAILPAEDRTRLIEELGERAAAGTPIFFDSNYRPRLWSAQEALSAVASLLPAVHIMLTSFEDEQCLAGDADVAATMRRLHACGVPRVVVKNGAHGCWWSEGEHAVHVPTQSTSRVIDTTAAGDSFNAAFMATWLAGHPLIDCCRAGNAMARTVIQHPGAIIPRAEMPSLSFLLQG